MVTSYIAPLTPTLSPQKLGGEGAGQVVGFFMKAKQQIGPIFSPLPQ
jgi:hypothetical protein